MTSIDFTQVVIKRIITHHIGNKLRDENINLSSEESKIEVDTLNYLLKYFLSPFNLEDIYRFFHSVNLNLNEVYSVVENIFSNQETFIDNSRNLAKLLYDYSMHPKIKKGELNIVLFSDAKFNDEIVDVIGIFKSENDTPFIKMNDTKSRFFLKHEFGFDLKGIDKGCLIFNLDKENGYKLLMVDNINKANEAQYWKDDFLKVEQISNEFQQTNQMLKLTKDFVTKQFSDEFVVSKADQIELLNRSVDYFKTHEVFDKNNFEKQVFQNKDVIKSFQNFNSIQNEYNPIQLTDNFEISSKAVKKQARVLKSVLKLDKNFHIYIHGNNEKIQQGIEEDGRKFYKIYYEKEF